MLPRAPFRLFRTALIGSILVGFSAGGHLAAGGRLPEPAILAALCAVSIQNISMSPAETALTTACTLLVAPSFTRTLLT